MRCKRTFFIILFFITFSTFSHAGDLGLQKYAGEFLELGVGARSLGMGSAQVAVARDVTAGYWNPAGLAFLEYPEVMLMHSEQFGSQVHYNFGSFGMPVGQNKRLGFSLIRVGIDDIIRTALPRPDLDVGDTYVNEQGQLVRNLPFEAGTFGSADYAFFMTYARRVTDVFSYGGNVKVLHRSIADSSAWGIGFDVGVMFQAFSKLQVGLNLQNVTTTMVAWETGRQELIAPSLRTGLTYPLLFNSLGGRIQPALDFIFRFENRQESALSHLGFTSVDVNLGWEYQYQDAFAIRLGASEVGNFTAGVGVHLPKLHIDYAFLGHQDLGSTHRISAKLTFEEPKFKRKN